MSYLYGATRTVPRLIMAFIFLTSFALANAVNLSLVLRDLKYRILDGLKFGISEQTFSSINLIYKKKGQPLDYPFHTRRGRVSIPAHQIYETSAE